MVSIPACHAGDWGSIPAVGEIRSLLLFLAILNNRKWLNLSVVWTLFKFFTQIKSFSVVKNGQKQQTNYVFLPRRGIEPRSPRGQAGILTTNTTEETDGCLNSFLNFSLKLSHFLLLRMAKNSNKLRISPTAGIEPQSPAWQAGILTTILPRKQMVVWTLF